MSPPDPRYAAFFEWDTRNEEHLARRGVTAREVEQVFANEPTWRRNKRGRAAQYAWTVAPMPVGHCASW